jgi:diguanylate cyclase (GGDEF)-like protein
MRSPLPVEAPDPQRVDTGSRSSSNGLRDRLKRTLPAIFGVLWVAAAVLTVGELRSGFSVLPTVLFVIVTSLLIAAWMRFGRSQALMAKGLADLAWQTSMVELLSRVSVASNEAQSTEEALGIAVREICDATGWPVGHAWLLSEDRQALEPSGVWHMSDPERFAHFKAESEALVLPSGKGLPGAVLKNRTPEWIIDVAHHVDFARKEAAEHDGIHAAFGFPILINVEVVGVLEFFATHPAEPDVALLEVMGHIGAQLGRVIERDRSDGALRALSLIDELTGLKNRRGFLDIATHELTVAQRLGHHLTLLFIELKDIKRINDIHGHTAGDLALIDTAHVLKKTFRRSDLVARLGGDEFCVLELGLANLGSIPRVEDALAEFNSKSDRPYQLALSVGAANFDPLRPVSLEELIDFAEGSTYRESIPDWSQRPDSSGSLSESGNQGLRGEAL